ncbi:hypothetical protein Prudu_014945 [Prunus dulcis]|uniref:Reverse transcriptase domain-containing protein n=1 Tax=Prunus dulcis TaxID=3755 RepID=A0A4Y1RI12_PRUDU|nr:hypothetical protein Prudu_014945 [Prunus dulcis]
MKSGFWQIQIDESDRYKTTFVTPFGHYEWNVMPFGLKNAPSEFQNIMNDIFNPYNASDIGYGGILKQKVSPESPEQIVRFHSGTWTQSQYNYRNTMAPKKDKNKEPASQPKPSQSQPKPSQLQHSRSTIGQIRPSYQSTLVASYDPFSVDVPAGPSVAPKKTSPYLPKSQSHLFVIEPLYDVHHNPVEIVKHYFPPGFHYMPSSPYKSPKYYRDILLETKSVEIKPIKDRDHPEIILYHSLYIHQIISQEAFSSRPYELKLLFIAMYKVPWILKWSYRITKDARIFAANFQSNGGTNSKSNELPIEGKSKSELQEISRQLIIQASQMDDDDEDNVSPASSSCQPLQDPVKTKSWYEDSQDPYDAYDLHSD